MKRILIEDFREVEIPVPWGFISGRWYGNQEVRPILAIHGWLDNLGTFDRLIPLLPDYIGMLCIDLPGHGRSSHLPPGINYGVYDLVYIIPTVVKHFGWNKVSLMGHSLGGIMSFAYTAMAPDTVDMVISLDILLPMRVENGLAIEMFSNYQERLLVEDDRRKVAEKDRKPPSYTLAQMSKNVAEASLDAVTEDLAHHLLHRQVKKAHNHPDQNKFYYSRDGRVKYFNYWDIDTGLGGEMARRIGNKPYLVLKGSLSLHLQPRCDEIFSILAKGNPHFEFYQVEGGTHHLHLQSAEECARYIVPFIQRHRPQKNQSYQEKGSKL
ncbi:probable serine hydrolase [Drosophila kikkawai]|uniref:Probable serine hydrolase n=1 Tax=Drosophila kikkawai TaxID=30033 RepID=A0A6P4IJ67_DROKI|nr:probable serine hydrolase [Drosophila kikkawai]